MTAALYVIGFLLALALAAVLCHLRDLRLYREDCEREGRDPAAPAYEPVGDHGRRVIKAMKPWPKPPLRVKALGVMEVDGGWGVLYSDGRIVPGYKTAEEAREALRLDNAKRP